MRNRMGMVVAILAGTGLLAGHAALAQKGAGDGHTPLKNATEVPPVFSKLAFADAMAQTKNSDKILVVKFTAEWCGPCKMMDRTTWRDERVEKWIKDNAVAIQVDVDHDQQVARDNHISAMPTMVAFKKGEMVERTVGYRSADQLLPWLDRAKNGEKKIDGLEAIVLPGDDKPEDNTAKIGMHDRLNAAREMIDAEKFDKATAEYLWLWKNMTKKEPAMIGVRGSFMAGDMERLANIHAPAMDAFINERDAVETRLKSPAKTFDDLDDWIVLNEVVGQESKTLEWFDRVKGDPDVGPTFDRVGFRLDNLLEREGRWADMGRILKDPIRELRSQHSMWKRMPAIPGADAEMRAHLKQVHDDAYRGSAAKIYASMLAAGREGDASDVWTEAIKTDDEPEMRVALIRAALKAGQARQSHEAVLEPLAATNDEAKATLRDLRKALADRAG